MVLLQLINVFRTTTSQSSVEWLDVFHYFVTSNALLALCLLVSYKQFGGSPIECLIPKMFSHGWEQVKKVFKEARNHFEVYY